VEEHTADLRDANLRLQRASAAKSQFLANMSHELRTPMNAIIGLTHLGLKTELSDQQREYLTTVDQSAQGLLGIIESILDFSDLDSGDVALDEQTFTISDVLERQAAVAGPAAEEKGLELLFEPAADLPTAVVGDPRRLGQVLAIFIGNAIKFTDQGGVRVDVTAQSTSDGAATILFCVTDSGPGMSAAEREHLFDPFSQADESHTRAHGGTGLGLAVASKLAALMDARIEVSSEPGQGSTFSLLLTLPLAPADDRNSLDAGAGDGLDLGPIRGARVLLVDDSDINLQVAGEILRQVPLRVDVAHDGQEAVTMTEHTRYDCVLMDVQMPVMDGYAATQAIRARAVGGDIPILAMTANVAPEDRARAEAAGMNAHIAKPVDPDRLLRELLTWIAPGEREPMVPEPADESEPLTELPDELPGIRVAEGLSRVGGNARLYLSLLKDLSRDYADCHTQLGELISAGEIGEAAALAHKLKGIANNLGVVDVGAQAAAMESALRAAEPVSDSALQTLAGSLEESSTAIEKLVTLQSPGQGGGEEIGGNALELLDRLEREIGESDPAASDTAEELLRSLDTDSAAVTAATAARDALELFDFENAAGQLAGIRAGLGS
jgi:CheY-like chemotaxis protein/HPt (histidine-containing phosphotransfer) domain-containing protein